MHYWRLLLLAFLAVLVAIAQADRLLVYGERRLLQEEKFCGKEARSLARDTRSALDGTRDEPSIPRERFDARSVTSRDNSRRTRDRDHQRLGPSEYRSHRNQITRERAAETARELRSVRDITRRESPEQRFSRDVRHNSFERMHSPMQVRSERKPETQLLTESRRTRELYGQRENIMKGTTMGQQSRRERTFTYSRSRSSELIRRERDNSNGQRDLDLNIRQNYRHTERTRQNDNRIFTNSQIKSFEVTRRERENINEQRAGELDSRQSRDSERFASRARRQSYNRIESRENSPRDRNYESRRIRELNQFIRRVRNFDGERSNSRFIREERILVRIQSNDRRNSDAQIRQEALTNIRTNERVTKRNTESRRVRSTEREDFRQMDKRIATGPVSERLKFETRIHPNHKNDIQPTTTSSLTYFFYTLQALYLSSVLFQLAGTYTSEKKNCGFLQFLTPTPSSVGKGVKVD